MKNMKRIAALVLALAMVFVLAACAKTKPAEDTAATTATTAAATTAPASTISSTILMEEDDSMRNDYSLIAVNPGAPFVDANGTAVSDVKINMVGADALIHWILSSEGKGYIAEYGKEEFGTALFTLDPKAPVESETSTIPQATDETKTIRLSTTTSVNDSGLLGYLLPKFEQKYGYKVEVASAGTGKAIEAAQMGNADLILVHAKAKEEDFINAGFARTVWHYAAPRLTFMYNYFVLIGPASDPAGVKNAATVLDAFKAIADTKSTFVSRGDGSGTHTKELSLWPADLGITEEATSFQNYPWYVSSNAGMGAVLTMAEQQNAYTLSDKATFLTFQNNNGVIE